MGAVLAKSTASTLMSESSSISRIRVVGHVGRLVRDRETTPEADELSSVLSRLKAFLNSISISAGSDESRDEYSCAKENGLNHEYPSSILSLTVFVRDLEQV